MGEAGKRKGCWALIFAGCARPLGESTPVCLTTPPSENTVASWCTEGALPEGEGGAADTVFANAEVLTVVRHPQGSLTAPGLGGGTVIDLAAWGHEDVISELTPLIGRGWLDVNEFEAAPEGIDVGGTTKMLPNQPPIEAVPASVRWTLTEHELCAEGADSLYLRVRGSGEKIGDDWWGETTVLRLGPTIEFLDEGWIAEGACLSVFSPEQPWPEGVPVSGTAVGAERVELAAAGERVGWLPVIDGIFGAEIPESVDQIRAVAEGFRPSEWASPEENIELAIGPSATLTVGHGGGRPVRMAWSNDAGQTGVSLIPAEGGSVTLGEGQYHLSFSAGPDAAFPDGDIAIVGDLALPLRFSEKPVTWASLTWDASVSRGVGAGLAYAVFTPENDISRQGSSSYIPFVSAGVETTGSNYRIWAWPLSANRRKPGHGAPDARDLHPDEALGMLLGTGTGRFAVVDLGWLEAAVLPWPQSPDFVRLDQPTAPSEEWLPWFSALDAGELIQPAGPWNGVRLEGSFGAADIERALIEGRSFASNGPVMEITPILGNLEVQVRGMTSGQAQWIGEGGVVLGNWAVGEPSPPLPRIYGKWAIAVAWNEGQWVVSAPILAD